MIDAENLDMLDRMHLSSEHDVDITKEERGMSNNDASMTPLDSN